MIPDGQTSILMAALKHLQRENERLNKIDNPVMCASSKKNLEKFSEKIIFTLSVIIRYAVIKQIKVTQS